MLAEGVRLMLVGMLTVFAFLTFLVGVMKASAAFFAAFESYFPEEPLSGSASSARGSVSDEDEAIALVLALAEAARKGQRI